MEVETTRKKIQILDTSWGIDVCQAAKGEEGSRREWNEEVTSEWSERQNTEENGQRIAFKAVTKNDENKHYSTKSPYNMQLRVHKTTSLTAVWTAVFSV